MGSDPEGFVTIRTNLSVEFWSFPEQQDLRKKLEKKSSPDNSQADPNKESSDWSEIVEAELPSSSVT